MIIIVTDILTSERRHDIKVVHHCQLHCSIRPCVNESMRVKEVWKRKMGLTYRKKIHRKCSFKKVILHFYFFIYLITHFYLFNLHILCPCSIADCRFNKGDNKKLSTD